MLSFLLLSAILFQDDSKLTFHQKSTNNFEILSNNSDSSNYLFNNVEFIKRTIYLRWGMEDIDFKNKCMIICIDDKDKYEELYKRSNGVFKPTFEHKGNKISAIWLYMNTDWRNSVLPSSLTEACLHEYAVQKNIKFPEWMIHGMMRLNSNEKSISILLSNSVMMTDFAHYDGENLLKGNVDNDDYRKWFDTESLLLCLFLKKEVKMKNFMNFCKKSPLLVIKDELGFESFEDFNYKFEKYMFNFSVDFQNGKVPSSYYLDIFQ